MMTSMRKTAVVRMAATVPKPRVRKEGRRAERPLEPRRSMKREMRRAMNVMPQAEHRWMSKTQRRRWD